jgi:hypothetical protein
MKIRHLGFVALAAGAVAGCSDDGPTFVNREPQAAFRYVNASPDSPTLDVRFVDKVENCRTCFGLGFRANTGQYQPVNAGQRQLRVFLASTTADAATLTTVVLDTTFTLEEGGFYTVVQTGRVGTGRGTANNNAAVTVIRDELPASVPAGQIALRVLHAATGVGNVDVAVNPRTTAAEGAVATTFAAAAFVNPTAYRNVPALAATDTSARYRFQVRAAGTTTPTLGNTLSTLAGLPGTPASVSGPALDPTAGVQQAQSVLTAVVFPAAIAGSAAASAATATPTVVLMQDRNPPRISQ